MYVYIYTSIGSSDIWVLKYFSNLLRLFNSNGNAKLIAKHFLPYLPDLPILRRYYT